jgi:hypothetical protein
MRRYRPGGRPWGSQSFTRPSASVTALCVGGWLLGKLSSSTPSAYLSLLVGLVLFYAATSIPFVGALFWLGWVVAGLGGLLLALKAMRTGAGSGVPAS